MTKFLEENDIDVLEFARKKEGKLSLEQEYGKHLNALGDSFNTISYVSTSDVSVLIHILINHILKPPSLPWKKPQTVHQSFLQKLVIF